MLGEHACEEGGGLVIECSVCKEGDFELYAMRGGESVSAGCGGCGQSYGCIEGY